MAGIYTRDNIPYSTMIQNAIANRNSAAQRDAGYITNFGNIVGGAVKDMGGVIGRGIAVTEDDDDLAKLRELEAERELLIKKEKENAANAMEGYRELPNMDGYRPNVVNSYRPDGVYNRSNSYALDFDNKYSVPGSNNATQSDYFKYQMAMNKLFGNTKYEPSPYEYDEDYNAWVGGR